MKRYLKVILTITIIYSSTSCKKDFLEVPVGSVILRQTYVTDLRTLQEFLNGIYTRISSDLYSYGPGMYPDLIADDVKPNAEDVMLSSYLWNQRVTDGQSAGLATGAENVSGHSVSLYNVAKNASFVIEKAEEFKSENLSTAESIKGQALAIRALAHYWLVNVFAQSYNFTPDASHLGVAYLTESDWKNANLKRNTVKEVYEKMIADLENAIAILPNSTSTVYFSRNAAKALLARIYLFKEDYQKARDYALEVANSVPIMTTNYPEKLFTNQATEALLQCPPSDPSYECYFAGYFYLYELAYATSDVAAVIREYPNDKRNIWLTESNGNWVISKYPEESYYASVLRSSEMYLTLAECYAKLNDETNAISYLDQIRLRAEPSLNPTIATGAALLDSIYKERRKELSFESFRMFDLLRWKKGVTRSDPAYGSPAQLPYPSDKAIAPIPSSDVKLYGFPQNPGY